MGRSKVKVLQDRMHRTQGRKVLRDGMYGMQLSQGTMGWDAAKLRSCGMGRMGHNKELHYSRGRTVRRKRRCQSICIGMLGGAFRVKKIVANV